jgi:hypothetical protein
MTDAHERLRSGETALLDVDLGLIPQLEPGLAQRLVERTSGSSGSGRAVWPRRRVSRLAGGQRREDALQSCLGLVDRHGMTFDIPVMPGIVE